MTTRLCRGCGEPGAIFICPGCIEDHYLCPKCYADPGMHHYKCTEPTFEWYCADCGDSFHRDADQCRCGGQNDEPVRCSECNKTMAEGNITHLRGGACVATCDGCTDALRADHAWDARKDRSLAQ